MRLVKFVLYGVIGVLALLVAIGLLLPSSAHVERSIEIEATPEQIFPWLNSPRAFNRWSPWAQRDPATQYRFEGPEQGVGAKMYWQSAHPEVGSGSQEIIASVPDQRVALALDFGTQGTAVAYYDLQQLEGTTTVTWGFDTEFGNDIVGRYFGIMLDTWLGPVYEKGLSNLKALVESPAVENRP